MASTRTLNAMGEELRRVYSLIPGLDPERVRAVPLEGGLTNRNFRLEHDESVLVLRLGGENASLLGIDRRVEHQATRWAAEVGLGASLVFADAQVDILVTQFITGSQLQREQAVQADTLATLARVIREVHEGPHLMGRFSPFDTVRSYHRQARERGVTFPDSLSEVLARAERLEQALGDPTPCPCHNDLLAANFIHDGQRWRLIDWEYAGMGDPFFDLANFSVNQELDEAANRALLHGYGVEVNEQSLARLDLMRLASDLREAFWGFLQAGISTLTFDYPGYARRHLERFFALSSNEELSKKIASVGSQQV